MRPLLWGCALVSALGACGPSVPAELQPDQVLRDSLGLTAADEVHRVVLTGGPVEVADPVELTVQAGVLVEFVTGDWRVHDVRFEMDSLTADGRSFLLESDQVASPPLVNLDQRFIVTFDGAPLGRYPYVVQGNGRPARGVVIVSPSP